MKKLFLIAFFKSMYVNLIIKNKKDKAVKSNVLKFKNISK